MWRQWVPSSAALIWKWSCWTGCSFIGQQHSGEKCLTTAFLFLSLFIFFILFFKQEKCKSRGNCCQTWHSLIHRFAVLLKWKLCRTMLFHITQGKACRQYYICNLAVALNIIMGMTLSYSLTLISITAWLKVWFNFFIQQFKKGVIVYCLLTF